MEGDRVVDLDDRPLRQHRIFGEGAELSVCQQVFVTEMPATGSVGGHLPPEQARADIADVALPVHAEPATAARRNERKCHVIPRLHARHTRPDLRDDTGPLVAAEQWEPVRRGLTARGHQLGSRHHVAGEQMVVGVANAGDGHPHQDLTAAGRIELDLADLPVPSNPANHSGTTLHCDLLDVWWLSRRGGLTARSRRVVPA
jgi:hypothetical protein